MTRPARDASLAEHERGTGSRRAGTRHSLSPAPVEAGVVIAQLRQRVRVWMDGDRILPADGSLLLAALDSALAELTEEHAPAARAGIEQFVGQVEALIKARVLEASDGHPPIEAATLLIAGLPRAGATDAETDR